MLYFGGVNEWRCVMTRMVARYEGELVVRCRHENGAEVVTFPPGVLEGVERELFSPTDLFAGCLGMCVLTMMGIRARKLGVDLTGAVVEMEKEMHKRPPFGVKRVTLVVRCPGEVEGGVRERLEAVGRECPLHHSVHPAIELDMVFKWGSDAV